LHFAQSALHINALIQFPFGEIPFFSGGVTSVFIKPRNVTHVRPDNSAYELRVVTWCSFWFTAV